MLTLQDSTGRAYTEEQIAGILAELERRVATHRCRACGNDNLFWEAQNQNNSGVPEGRLRTQEISCSFVLGCETCSETLHVISADKVATGMTNGLDPLYTVQLEGRVRVAEADKDRLMVWLAQRDAEILDARSRFERARDLLHDVLHVAGVDYTARIKAFLAETTPREREVYGMNFEIFNTPEEITARIVELAGTAKAIIRGTNGSVHTLKWN